LLMRLPTCRADGGADVRHGSAAFFFDCTSESLFSFATQPRSLVTRREGGGPLMVWCLLLVFIFEPSKNVDDRRELGCQARSGRKPPLFTCNLRHTRWRPRTYNSRATPCDPTRHLLYPL